MAIAEVEVHHSNDSQITYRESTAKATVTTNDDDFERKRKRADKKRQHLEGLTDITHESEDKDIVNTVSWSARHNDDSGLKVTLMKNACAHEIESTKDNSSETIARCNSISEDEVTDMGKVKKSKIC